MDFDFYMAKVNKKKEMKRKKNKAKQKLNVKKVVYTKQKKDKKVKLYILTR